MGCVGVFTIIVLSQIFSYQIVSAFTVHENIKTVALSVWYLKLIDFVPDLQKGIQNGMVQALAIQKKSLWLSILFEWIVMMPMSYFLAFTFEMELAGIWIAKCTKEYLLYTTKFILIERSDWEKCAR